MKGRRPKPTHLKAVRGNPGKRANKREPRPVLDKTAPPPPEHLNDNATRAWENLAPMLVRLRVLTEADHLALERLALCYAEVCEHEETLSGLGYTYETHSMSGDVMVRKRPEAALLADADRRFKSYLVEFGLTPAARSKVEADGEDEGAGKAASYFTK